MFAAVHLFGDSLELWVVHFFVNREFIVLMYISLSLLHDVQSLLMILIHAIDMTILIACIFWRRPDAKLLYQFLMRIFDVFKALPIQDSLVRMQQYVVLLIILILLPV